MFSRLMWIAMSPSHRLFYKDIYRCINPNQAFYTYDFWFWVANAPTTIRDWFIEFGEALPSNLPLKY